MIEHETPEPDLERFLRLRVQALTRELQRFTRELEAAHRAQADAEVRAAKCAVALDHALAYRWVAGPTQPETKLIRERRRAEELVGRAGGNGAVRRPRAFRQGPRDAAAAGEGLR